MSISQARRSLGLLLVCALAGLFPVIVSAQEAVRFTIVDHLSPGQVEEVITVYLDGRNVGTLRVDATRAEDRLQVSAPRAERYEYALCGRLRVRDGAVTEREINDGGILRDVDGRTFAAYTEGEAVFYLLDDTPGRPPVVVERDNKPRCTAAIAAR